MPRTDPQLIAKLEELKQALEHICRHLSDLVVVLQTKDGTAHVHTQEHD